MGRLLFGCHFAGRCAFLRGEGAKVKRHHPIFTPVFCIFTPWGCTEHISIMVKCNQDMIRKSLKNKNGGAGRSQAKQNGCYGLNTFSE